MSSQTQGQDRYAVQLHSDPRRGIVPFTDTGNDVENYGYMREFAAWFDGPDSKASRDLRMKRFAPFYVQLEDSQSSATPVPSYAEYRALVDAYNLEQNYARDELPDAPEAEEPSETDRLKRIEEQIERKFEELKQELDRRNVVRPRRRDKAKGWLKRQYNHLMAYDNDDPSGPRHSVTQTPPPPAAQPTSTNVQAPPAGTARRQH